MIGVVYQFVLIAGVLSISLVLMMRLISKRLWVPFDDTLHRIEQFSLEGENIPHFMQSDIKEFTRLNNAITQLMKKFWKAINHRKSLQKMLLMSCKLLWLCFKVNWICCYNNPR